ncbi:hypothetical protein Cme02nite_34520 [Catellatospora methionotrophica]|uniref:Uncharacterized protein n=1 Tax=Catellatospora methionotrophica TaxID=121620 RepID=A0A8J3LM12_9ACTN|nr:hypothetical protein [Catellatospora methionotrophica]GIG15120.1 hypothetical protein Cme02nite_34520 [Catellatospora methionotrophica]
MAYESSLRGLLHRATHRVPGVSAHVERPTGHQGAAHHGRAQRRGIAAQASRNHGGDHSSAHPPRFMPAWQRRIAALFGQEV